MYIHKVINPKLADEAWKEAHDSAYAYLQGVDPGILNPMLVLQLRRQL